MMNNEAMNPSSSIVELGSSESTTSRAKVLSFAKEKRTNATMEESSISCSSTPKKPEETVSPKEQLLFSDEYYEKERIYEELLRTKEQEVLYALRNFSFEYEMESQAEELILCLAEKYSMRFLGEILSNIYIKYFGEQRVISGICVSLERFDPDEVSPWGQSIVIGLINHKSLMVQERVVNLIDNWGDKSLLPALKNIDVHSTWMREYVDSVIAYLDDK